MNKQAMAMSAVVMAVSATAPGVMAQSSSLFVTSQAAPAPPVQNNDLPNGERNHLSPALAQISLSAVRVPEAKKFSVNDLVTVIVREDTSAAATAQLDAKKTSNMTAAVNAMPSLDFMNFIKAKIQGSTLTDPPKVDTAYNSEFKGDSTYTRQDTLTSRVQARIIDIKPNGTMVIEARKFIKSDKESLDLVLTGTCRKQDVAADNTVQSTQIYDLRIVKEHKGELKNSTTKGIITKFFDVLFNF